MEPPPPAEAEPFGSVQVASASTISPDVFTTSSLAGDTAYFSRRAVAVPMLSVVVAFSSQRSTVPTPATSTCCSPEALTVTGLPRTVTLSASAAFAVGFLPASQEAVAVRRSALSSGLAGRPAANARTPTSLTLPTDRCASALTLECATSALTRVVGCPLLTPFTSAVSSVCCASPGALRLLSDFFTGTLPTPFTETLRSARAATAVALPVEPEFSCAGTAEAGPAARATPIARAVTLRRAAGRTGLLKTFVCN